MSRRSSLVTTRIQTFSMGIVITSLKEQEPVPSHVKVGKSNVHNLIAIAPSVSVTLCIMNSMEAVQKL